jgi:hypothetical protein
MFDKQRSEAINSPAEFLARSIFIRVWNRSNQSNRKRLSFIRHSEQARGFQPRQQTDPLGLLEPAVGSCPATSPLIMLASSFRLRSQQVTTTS